MTSRAVVARCVTAPCSSAATSARSRWVTPARPPTARLRRQLRHLPRRRALARRALLGLQLGLRSRGNPASAHLGAATTTPSTAAVATSLRYDSPSLGGVATIAAAVGNNEYWDLGVFVDTALAGGQLSVNAGYSHDGNAGAGTVQGRPARDVGFLPVLAGHQRHGGLRYRRSPRSERLRRQLRLLREGRPQVGQQRRLHRLWPQHVRQRLAGVGIDVETDSIGLAFVHTLPKAGVEAYAGYHYHWADHRRRRPASKTSTRWLSARASSSSKRT